MTLGYDLGGPAGGSKTLGMIVLQSDETIEHDARRLLPLDVGFHVSRVPVAQTVNDDTLGQMALDLPTSAALLPVPAQYSVIGYGCTSGTSVIGAEKIADLVRQGHDTVAVTDPLTALIAACRHLGVTRLAFISPYIEPVSAGLRDRIEDAGIAVTSYDGFDEDQDENVARITKSSLMEAARSMGEGDAIFMSCTSLQTLDIIEPLERELGRAILSSNQVLLWHMAQLSGIAMDGPGRLFQD